MSSVVREPASSASLRQGRRRQAAFSSPPHPVAGRGLRSQKARRRRSHALRAGSALRALRGEGRPGSPRERVPGPDGLDNGDGKSGHACAGFAEVRRRCPPPVLDHHDARRWEQRSHVVRLTQPVAPQCPCLIEPDKHDVGSLSQVAEQCPRCLAPEGGPMVHVEADGGPVGVQCGFHQVAAGRGECGVIPLKCHTSAVRITSSSST